MLPERLTPTVHTLFAELVERLRFAPEGSKNGSFVTKTVSGRTYWYLQRSEGTRKTQTYLGPESPELLASIDQARAQRAENDINGAGVARLTAMLAQGGAFAESAAQVKVLEMLAEARVFALGGVLIGTPAFAAFGNLLGFRFADSTLRTQDVDIAQDPQIAVALAGDTDPSDVSATLARAEPPFLPIPGLDPRTPSTSWSVRGREMRVDFLTPLRGKPSEKPIYLPLFKLAAFPLRLLDYLIEGAISSVIFDRRRAVLVNLPDPARFAWHKLWTAEQRGPGFQAKVRKDLWQANQLFEVLLEDRPEDLVAARLVLKGQAGVEKALERSLAKLDPSLVARLRGLSEGHN